MQWETSISHFESWPETLHPEVPQPQPHHQYQRPVHGGSSNGTAILTLSYSCMYLLGLITASSEPWGGTQHWEKGLSWVDICPTRKLMLSQSTLGRGAGRPGLSFPMLCDNVEASWGVLEGCAGFDISLGGSLFPRVSLTAAYTLYKDQLFRADDICQNTFSGLINQTLSLNHLTALKNSLSPYKARRSRQKMTWLKCVCFQTSILF